MTVTMLGLDTATSVTTVALVEADVQLGRVRVRAELSHDDARRHGEVLPALVRGVVQEAGTDIASVSAVVVGVGPGAYTGLRVGIATAEAMGLVLSVPVRGVVTLDAMAFATGRSDPFAVVTDARRREVFVAEYLDWRTPRGEPRVGHPEVIATALGGIPVVAPEGAPTLPGHDTSRCAPPCASDLCAVAVDRLHRGIALTPVRPLYMRRPDVSVSSAPKSVLS